MSAWILVLTIWSNADGHSTIVTIPQSSKAVCEASAAAWLKNQESMLFSTRRANATCLSG